MSNRFEVHRDAVKRTVNLIVDCILKDREPQPLYLQKGNRQRPAIILMGNKRICVRGTSLKKDGGYQVHDSDIESYKKLYDLIAFVNLHENEVRFLTPSEVEPLRKNQGTPYRDGANCIFWNVVKSKGRKKPTMPKGGE